MPQFCISSGVSSDRFGVRVALWVGALALLATAPSVADAGDGKPATVAEAARVIDFTTFPMLPEAENLNRRRVAGLTYKVDSTVAKAFDFQKQKLTAAKWKELPNSYSSDQSASATFSRDGFAVSVSVISAGKPGNVMVSLTNHGNVDVQKLPVPKDAKSLYTTPVSAAWVTPESVEKTAAAIKKLLTAQGWQPYGTAGDSLIFKQNAVRLNARASVAPAQGGKTVIDFSTDLMSADIPAPVETLSLQYSDSTMQVLFDTAAGKNEIYDFYRKTLAAAGWKATTEKPFQIDFKDSMIFRNPAQDMLTLETYTVDEKLRVIATQMTGAEVAELDKRIQEEADRRKKAKEDAANKPEKKFAIKLPAGAKGVKQEKGSLEFTVGAGKAKAAVEDLRKQFAKAGWKEDVAALEDMAGTISFAKGDENASILYVDTGFMPAEITVSGKVEVEKPDAGK